MEKFLPATFLEFIGGGLAVVAVLAGLLSLCASLRTHLLRILAITFICALAIFSNHVTTYFVAIFVIATAVTELEFLQNLAAIVRGNKEYFDYRKEVLSTDVKLKNIATEVSQASTVPAAPLADPCMPDPAQDDSPAKDDLPVEGGPIKTQDTTGNDQDGVPPAVDERDIGDAPIDAPIPDELSSEKESGFDLESKLSASVKRIYELETKALDRLEKLYGKGIERGVKIVSAHGASVQLDGLITNSAQYPDVLFELKYIRSALNFISWAKLLGLHLSGVAKRYEVITNKAAEVHLVIIMEDKVKLTARQRDVLNALPIARTMIFHVGELES